MCNQYTSMASFLCSYVCSELSEVVATNPLSELALGRLVRQHGEQKETITYFTSAQKEFSLVTKFVVSDTCVRIPVQG